MAIHVDFKVCSESWLHPKPSRIFGGMARSFISTLLAAFVALSFACSSDDPDPPDPTPDVGFPDSGVDGGIAGPSSLTLHYHRTGPAEAATYAGWTVTLTGDVDAASATSDAIDDFGATYEIPLAPGAQSITYVLTDGTLEEQAVTVDVSMATEDAVWHWQGAAEARLTAPPAIPTANQILFYYLRGDGNYTSSDTNEQFGIYTWGERAPAFAWPNREMYDGIDDDLGAYFLIDLTGTSNESCPLGDFCFIVQAGNDATKDPDADRGIETAMSGNQLFLATADERIYTCPERESRCRLGAGQVAIQGARAHLVRSNTLAWDVGADGAASYELRYSADAGITLDGDAVVGGEAIPLTAAGTLSAEILAEKPHLTGFGAFSVGAIPSGTINDVLRGQILAIAYNAAGEVIEATQVQMPGALDELYPYDGPLGLDFSTTPTRVRLWAPTAQDVAFQVYDTDLNLVTTATLARDAATGVWSRTIDPAWVGGYYQYEVTVYHPVTRDVETYSVTDPYSTSLSTDSTHTHLVDVMNATELKPAGWDTLVKPPLDAPEDITIYELHVRDFSLADAQVAEADKGKFTAFTYNGQGGRPLSDGMDHLIQLGQAGLTHVHLLPAFDIATVREDPADRVEITDSFDRLCMMATVPADLCTQFAGMTIRAALESYDASAEDQQQIVSYMRDLDGFNWGYDPFHYTAPEGSYSTNPMGGQRVLEFRQMVQALAEVGMRTALDVVYNHTNSSGVSSQSVLDRIVPWYYHRLDPLTGIVAAETCCQDTATENRMMEKLMIDSVIFWAKAYKLDAFRFDLMGYHLREHMVALRAELDALTEIEDGVDGTKVFVYGEGWNPGGQAQSRATAESPNATQISLDNTGIGTFSDRLRDAARGGGPFDSGETHVLNQGWLNGLGYDPNDPADFNSSSTRNPTTDANTARRRADWIRVGLAGALRRYRLVDRTGAVVSGAAVDYNGAIGGYTSDPEEVITYVEKHDNETLFDISNYKNPLDTTMAERVRVQNLGIDLVALGQGVPFFHAGMDLMRSKSMDRNSFNSGDWFNTIDWTGATTNFAKGLPQQPDNQNNWPFQTVVLDQASLSPAQSDVLAVAAHMREMLEIRKSSPLFRLRTEADIQRRLSFLAGGPDQRLGLIAMGLTDGTNCPNPVDDIDPNYDAVVVVFNASTDTQAVDVDEADGFALHPVQAGSADTVVQGATVTTITATVTTSMFLVPPRTTAVFVDAQEGAQGAGLPCNPNEP